MGTTTSDPKVGAHRAAWILVHGQLPAGISVCHRCDNPICVNPSHLFLGTHADNMADASQKGRMAIKRGTSNPAAKLRPTEVDEIRRAYAAGGVTQKDLAQRFGVSRAQVSLILGGKRWAQGAAHV